MCNEIKVDYERVLQIFYDKNKYKLYYNSSTVKKLSGISERTLRTRINDIKDKYGNVPALVYMKHGEYRFHYSLLEEFKPKNKPRILTPMNYPWKSFLTWAMADRYDDHYHCTLVNELKEMFPINNFYFTVEKNSSGNKHVHLLADVETQALTEAATILLNRYIEPKMYRLDVSDIRSKSQSITYIKK